MARRVPHRRGEAALIDAIAVRAIPLAGSLGDHDRLLEEIGNARVVLLGEATHGTEEFYRERALITRRLVAEKGFTAVAVEADWPDAYRANRYVRGISSDDNAVDALSGFARFPTWMWRNHAVVEFLEWLKEFNEAYHEAWSAVGFYGLDLYSLYTSVEAVIDYLQSVDPEAAKRARQRYGCLDRDGSQAHGYGWPPPQSVEACCEKEVVEQLAELMENRSRYAVDDEVLAEDEFFFAEQNARLAASAEAYYRTMYRGGASSWNLRDRHMMETLQALIAHLSSRHDEVRLVVWAHNSHLGDARYTSMGRAGEWNLGQLVREEYGDSAFLVGFTTWGGEVTAAQNWDSTAERMRVRPALEGSYEDLFHRVGIGRFTLPLRSLGAELGSLHDERLERMIGVVYRPQTERFSHYFECDLVRQFDAVLHLDVTQALEPLETAPRCASGEPPETFPSAL
jgi:erythromycin esterase-like protein